MASQFSFFFLDLVQTISLGQIRLLYFSFLTKYLLKVVESTYETMILILNQFPNHTISYIIKKAQPIERENQDYRHTKYQ